MVAVLGSHNSRKAFIHTAFLTTPYIFMGKVKNRVKNCRSVGN